MKKIFIILLCHWTIPSYGQFGDSFPILKFDHDTVDFGTVVEGDTVRYDFSFINIGNKPLIIKQAYPACGCTYPTFTQGPILPGQRGVIHVAFYSQGWGGQSVLKEVIVILGNGPENYARFKAKIIKRSELPIKGMRYQSTSKKRRRQNK